MTSYSSQSPAELLPLRIEADDEEDVHSEASVNGEPRYLKSSFAFLNDIPSWSEYVRENGADVLTLLGVGLLVS